MKKITFVLLLLLLFVSCSDNGFDNRNPNIPDYRFSVTLNLAFYQNLTYPSNAIYYRGADVGPRGIYIFNTGSGYNAFDAACPNQPISDCSTMTIKGVNLICPCDDEEYSMFTGQGKLQYPLKQYRVEINNNMIRVYN